MVFHNIKIKEMPADERPREKLIRHGPEFMTDIELLAIILQNGSAKNNVIELSEKIFRQNDLKELSRKGVNSLKSTLGIGEAKACQIISCFELGRRLASYRIRENPKINTAADIAELFLVSMSSLKKEHFIIVLLDSRKKMIKHETIFIGSLNSSIVHPREIFKPAIEECAAAVVLLHNHPSGIPEPSKEDINFTKQLLKGGKILGIDLLDHIIIGEQQYFSFRESGYI